VVAFVLGLFLVDFVFVHACSDVETT